MRIALRSRALRAHSLREKRFPAAELPEKRIEFCFAAAAAKFCEANN